MTKEFNKLLSATETKKAIREALVDAGVKCAKDEIRLDVRKGIVPRGVSSFGGLHDYVDANEYGGSGFLCHLFEPDDIELDQQQLELLNEIQDAIDKWIKTGGHVAEE